MKQYMDEELDDIIRVVVGARMENCNPPPVEEAWARLKERINYRPKQLSFNLHKRYLPHIALTVVLILLVATFFSFTNPIKARALGYKIIDSVEAFLYSPVMNLRSGVRGDDKTKPTPPPQTVKEINTEPQIMITLEEAKTKVPFPLRVPTYLPPAYHLKKVTYQKQTSYTAEVTMEYKGPKDNYFTITQLNFTGELGTGYAYDREDTTIKNVMIGSNKAKIAQSKSGFVRLMWIDGQINLNLEGKLSSQEAIKIARSIFEHRGQK